MAANGNNGLPNYRRQFKGDCHNGLCNVPLLGRVQPCLERGELEIGCENEGEGSLFKS